MFIDIIAGARPNFVKIAAIIHAIRESDPQPCFGFRLVHTGQHYDQRMSGDFFEQLEIPEPDVNLEVGSGTQAEQTARIMIRYEELIMAQPPAATLVVGDVTSTMACAIVAQKQGVPVAHVEAGIRSGDWTMPEEINRLVTDSITNWFFTTSEIANAELRRTGVSEDRIFFVGNTMIDTLMRNRHRFKQPDCFPRAISPCPIEETGSRSEQHANSSRPIAESGTLSEQHTGSPRPIAESGTLSEQHTGSPLPIAESGTLSEQHTNSPLPIAESGTLSEQHTNSPLPIAESGTRSEQHTGSPRPFGGRGVGGEGARPAFDNSLETSNFQLPTSPRYLLLTLHRPSNVDNAERLREILTEIAAGSSGTPIIFPVHPRTRQKLESAGIQLSSQYLVVEPLPYLEFGYLIERACGIITDSGGITEEATVLGIPCMTLRNSTERPETVELGTNELIGSGITAIFPAIKRMLDGDWKQGSIPPLWDGQTGQRIVSKLAELLIKDKLARISHNL